MTTQTTARAASLHNRSAGRACVIDLGTNSFHALVVEPTKDGGFVVIDKLKLPVKLGEAGLSTGQLTHDAVSRATRALTQITTLARRRGAEQILAYATSAIREADNGDAFVTQIKEELGLEIEPIAGDREAHLIYLGVRRTLELSEPALLVDIGGGSTEFIIASGDDAPLELSLKLGAARLTENFVSSDPIQDNELTELREHIGAELAPVIAACKEHGVEEIIGSSGTMEVLATLAMGSRHGSPEQHVFSADELAAVASRLIASDEKARRKLSAVDERRIDQIVAGAVLLGEIIQATGATRVRLSPAALREGMVDELFSETNAKNRGHGDADILVRHARQLCAHHGGDLEHADEVAELAIGLFDELDRTHKLRPKDRRLLRIAALVHDVGHAISGRAHHKHSRYIIAQTTWPGVKPKDVTLISLIARYHRAALPKKKHTMFRSLKKRDRQRVRQLGAMLRLADQLDRSHIGNTEKLRIGTSKKQVHVTIATRLSPEIELEAARRTAAAFKDAFRRELVVHAAWQPKSDLVADDG